jgi:hypothetical protein
MMVVADSGPRLPLPRLLSRVAHVSPCVFVYSGGAGRDGGWWGGGWDNRTEEKASDAVQPGPRHNHAVAYASPGFTTFRSDTMR